MHKTDPDEEQEQLALLEGVQEPVSLPETLNVCVCVCDLVEDAVLVGVAVVVGVAEKVGVSVKDDVGESRL